jgi:microcystin-dependent protein
MVDYFIGTIQLYPYGFAPQNWALCDGSMLSIMTYQALYSLLGTRFGGNGSTTFGVPNLQAAANGNIRYYICTQGMYPSWN